MDILDLCRHFGKRYFWPHLLLGIVTASIGIPTTLAKVSENMSHTSQLLPHYQQNLALDNLIAASKYRIFYNCGANYWHQHALRNMIRQLTFFSAQETQKQLDANLSAHNKPISLYNMLDTLYSMINLSLFHTNKQNFSYLLTQSFYHIFILFFVVFLLLLYSMPHLPNCAMGCLGSGYSSWALTQIS